MTSRLDSLWVAFRRRLKVGRAPRLKSFYFIKARESRRIALVRANRVVKVRRAA